MDIEGLGHKILEALIANGLVTDPADLYALEVPALAKLERLGQVSATNLVNAIQGSKAQPLSRVLTGLGVRMTGRSMSRRLARHFGTMDALLAADVAQLQQVEGVGPERAAMIAAELVELTPLIEKLAAAGVNMAEPQDAVAPSIDRMPLQNPDGTPMTVVVTGSVPGLTRTEGNEAVERLGGKSSGSVSKKTNLVVVGDGAGSKADKAAELGVRVMPSDRFAELLAAFDEGDADAVAELIGAE
jgi:DNA ligase (NAD+)